ncbi:MAG: Hsp70 family protein, partial [Acidimicrobiales bacterium]
MAENQHGDGTAYHLGIDLGTTYVAAGILEQGRPEIITLGDRAPVLPSVLYFREDGEVLTGESATRRGLSDPTRVVREFKRRVGDTTPLVVGQTPYSVDVLMAKLVRFVHDAVVERQGAAPQVVAVTHPANWGPYKIDVLEQAVRLAGIGEVTTITEPVAAAIHYAAAERLDPGEAVAVYDLGGGTFDAAVLRKTDHDFEVLGEVEGIERLGGIDFDEAVFQHVVRFCEPSLAELDVDDPAVIQALARLRQECVEAKEVLSTDTEVTIPVALPNLQTEVRLTRAEFEAMIRPLLRQTVDALRRAISSADVEPGELSAVLLVGGCSRIPLISEMVGAELGRPIAVDRHPKHTVALGAAIAAGRSAQAPE